MKTGNCEVCGEWSDPLIEGVCEPCVRNLVGPEMTEVVMHEIVTPETDHPPATPTERYTTDLAARVHEILSDVHEMPSPSVVGHIISEALFQAAQDASHGCTVRLEYIGELNVLGNGLGVTYTPTEWVLPAMKEAI